MMRQSPIARADDLEISPLFSAPVKREWRFPIPATTILAVYLLVNLGWLLVARRYTNTPTDETFALLMLPAAIGGAVIYWRNTVHIPIIFAIYALVGLTSMSLAHIGGVLQPRAAIVDVLLDAKIFIIFLGFYFLIRRERYVERTFIIMARWLIGIALVNGVFVLRDVFLGHGYGLFGQRLIPRAGFYQPQGLVFHHLESCYLSMMAALAALAMYRLNRTPVQLALAIFLGGIFMVHLSAKELLAYLLCVVLFFIGQRGRAPTWVFTLPLTISVLSLVVFLTPIGRVFWGQYDQYIGSNSGMQVRSVMTAASFDISSRYFPLGAGAGTFASPPSIQFGYSNLYYQYNLAKMWGATPDNPNFVLDVFWPKILAETGWLGFVAYASLLIVIALPLVRWFMLTRSAVSWFCMSLTLCTALMSIAATPYNNEYLSILWSFTAAMGAVAYMQDFGRPAREPVRRRAPSQRPRRGRA